MGTIETREYAQGTSVTQEHPWGFYIRARVMCPDGIVRATSKLQHDPTPVMTAHGYGVPCSVNVRKAGPIYKVAGVMVDVDGTMTFTPNPEGKNAGAFDIPATVQRRGANRKFIAA